MQRDRSASPDYKIRTRRLLWGRSDFCDRPRWIELLLRHGQPSRVERTGHSAAGARAAGRAAGWPGRLAREVDSRFDRRRQTIDERHATMMINKASFLQPSVAASAEQQQSLATRLVALVSRHCNLRVALLGRRAAVAFCCQTSIHACSVIGDEFYDALVMASRWLPLLRSRTILTKSSMSALVNASAVSMQCIQTVMASRRHSECYSLLIWLRH